VKVGLVVALPLLAIGPLAAAQSAIAPTQAASPITGCYVVRLGAWSWTVGDEKGYYTPPDTIRLFSDGHVTPTIPYTYGPDRGWASWLLVQTDSIVIRWSNGFALAVLAVGRRNGDLRGTLEAISDAHPIPAPPPRVAPAVLHPTACQRGEG
jgi:hypothetical protein